MEPTEIDRPDDDDIRIAACALLKVAGVNAGQCASRRMGEALIDHDFENLLTWVRIVEALEQMPGQSHTLRPDILLSRN
jgi:hypothetical protein